MGCAIATMAGALKTKSKAQKASEKVAKAREEFFTNITHELRTPLTVVLGMADRLANGKLAQQETPQSAGKIILRQSKNLSDLVENLLDFSKIKSALNPPQTKSGDIVKHIQTVVENFEQFAKDKNVVLKFLPEIDSLNAIYPNDYLDKILNNLISNAIKYSKPTDGFVNVATNYHDKTFFIKVTDNGIGISTENLKHIFDYFFRENQFSGVTGTGIGLALTKLCVRAIGGRISVKSELGNGSEFLVEFPLQELPHIIPQKITETEDETLKKILIVEDNPDISYFISSELQNTYSVCCAGDGAEGLKKAAEIVPDLIISDVMMPNVNGLQMAEQIRNSQLLNHIPIIFVTAKTAEKDKIAGLNAGAVAYLYKPFNSNELNALIENLLAMRDSLRKKYSEVVLLQKINQKNINQEVEQQPENKQKVDSKSQDTKPIKEKSELNPQDIKFLEKFNLHLSNGIKIGTFDAETLAGNMCLSRSQLNRKILALTGLNTTAYIIRQRIGLAQKLLKDDAGMQVGDVTMQCGFDDVSYFSRIFKQVTGSTPRDFRKN